jgi:flagellar hook-associated protein 3 FlgL
MRISSNAIFNSNVSALDQQQSKIFKTQQQISTGLRMSSAADDPVAAAGALDVSQSLAINTQYISNQKAALSTLSMAGTIMQSVTSLLQNVRDTVISAENGSLSASDLKTIASNLNGSVQELMGLANSKDGQGNYLFSGFQTGNQPFLNTPSGVAYFGDDGPRNIQVSSTRQIASSDSGADIFMRIKNGNGTFATQASSSNTGTGLISQGNVINPALLTGDNYSVTFNVVGGVTTYDVTNTTTSTTVSSGNAYVSGQAISFDGMQFNITGAPVNGDTFTVTPSTNQSIFKTITDIANALNTPVVGANQANSLSQGINNLDSALNNVLNVQSSQGMRINEVNSLQTMGGNVGLQLQNNLSQLQDTDFTKAASDLAQQTMVLQAAQKSFALVAGNNMSLFNYI